MLSIAESPAAEIASVDTNSVDIRPARSAADVAAAKTLFVEYLRFVEDFLGESLNFQGTAREFADFPAGYDELFLATLHGKPVGAVGLKAFSPRAAELKRLWVRPEARGMRLGESLVCAAIHAARRDGYATMLLDTDPGLHHANSVYERVGFTDVPAYYPNPRAERSRYMELRLNEARCG